MLAVILGLISGVVFGLTGSGGGIVATPFTMYGLGMPIHLAISVTLLTLSFTGIVGVIKLRKEISSIWQEGLVISLTGIVASIIGSALNPLIPAKELTLLFAIFLLIIGSMVWRNSSGRTASPDVKSKRQYSILCLVGVVAGFLNGFLGISGGVVVVSALIIFLHYPMRQAAAISILIVAVISTISSIVHFYFSWREMHWTIALIFVASSGVGMWVAAHFANRIPERFLKRGLAVIILLLGVSMLIKTILKSVDAELLLLGI